VVIKHLEI